MNICIVSPFFTPFVKSSEYGFAQTLTEFGHEATILTSTSDAPREKMVTKKKSKEQHNFKVKYLKSIDFAENPFAPSVFLHILRSNFDVVMLREDYPFMCHLAYFASKIKRIPTILTTERTYKPQGFKGFFLRVFDVTINRVLRSGADAYTAHCNAAMDFARKNLGTSRKMVLTPVGIDTYSFDSLPGKDFTYIKDGDLKLLTVARLHEYKGLQYLIKALGDVVQEKKDIKLYILGKGPEKKKLEKLVKDMKIDDNVVFMNIAIPNQEMPQLYSECDLYVQPSIIEPFGIAVLEAMACGKPVVGTKTGGMLDTIVDGVTGFSVPPANVEELAGAIMKLVKDRDLLVRMGEHARKKALQYDWKLVASKYLDVISSIR